jgi:hypothetical protein
MTTENTSVSGIAAQVAAKRGELETALDELEDKFNVPKQAKRLGDWAMDSYDENPVPWIVTAAAVAVGVVSLIAWAIFSGDE